MTTSDRYALRFVLLGVCALWLGALFGLIGSWQHVIPGIIEWVPFVKSRPLHVSLVIGWIFMAAVGGIYYYLPRITGTTLFAPRWVRLHLVVWVITGFAIIGSYLMGRFGGREYWEFPPILGAVIAAAWLLLVVNFFRTAFKRKGPWPAYLWMWTTGIVFFLFTFLEAYGWLWLGGEQNVIRDITVQWKAYGALTGSWNMLVYGTAMVVMERISGDRAPALSRTAFLIFALGFTNLLFGWAHHIYPVPSALWLRILAYVISMTEWILLARMIRQWRGTLDAAQRHAHLSAWRFLYASEVWVFLNLGLALLISIPAINLFAHGTFIIVAHAMGSTIGINTMILFASVFHLVGTTRHAGRARTAFHLVNGSLVVFWLGLIGAGMVKGWYTVMSDLSFQAIMELVRPFLVVFAVAGIGLFTGLTMLAAQAIRNLRNPIATSTNTPMP